MSALNADVPNFLAQVRAEFLYNLEAHHGEYEDVCVFGLASIAGRALGFHMLTATGAQIVRVPIHALVHRRHGAHIPLSHLQLWDCFSYDVAVTEFAFLSELRCDVWLRSRQWVPGTYQFTVDWYGNRLSEDAGDNGHKNAHVIALDCGCYAAQPNNRIRWHEPSFIVRPFDKRPDYQTNCHTWKCEGRDPTEDSNRFFYDYMEPDAIGQE